MAPLRIYAHPDGSGHVMGNDDRTFETWEAAGMLRPSKLSPKGRQALCRAVRIPITTDPAALEDQILAARGLTASGQRIEPPRKTQITTEHAAAMLEALEPAIRRLIRDELKGRQPKEESA